MDTDLVVVVWLFITNFLFVPLKSMFPVCMYVVMGLRHIECLLIINLMIV